MYSEQGISNGLWAIKQIAKGYFADISSSRYTTEWLDKVCEFILFYTKVVYPYLHTICSFVESNRALVYNHCSKSNYDTFKKLSFEEAYIYLRTIDLQSRFTKSSVERFLFNIDIPSNVAYILNDGIKNANYELFREGLLRFDSTSFLHNLWVLNFIESGMDIVSEKSSENKCRFLDLGELSYFFNDKLVLGEATKKVLSIIAECLGIINIKVRIPGRDVEITLNEGTENERTVVISHRDRPKRVPKGERNRTPIYVATLPNAQKYRDPMPVLEIGDFHFYPKWESQINNFLDKHDYCIKQNKYACIISKCNSLINLIVYGTIYENREVLFRKYYAEISTEIPDARDANDYWDFEKVDIDTYWDYENDVILKDTIFVYLHHIRIIYSILTGVLPKTIQQYIDEIISSSKYMDLFDWISSNKKDESNILYLSKESDAFNKFLEERFFLNDKDNDKSYNKEPHIVNSPSHQRLEFPTRFVNETSPSQIYAQEREPILTEIFKVYGSSFENMSCEDFLYLFGASSKTPSTYNPPYYWSGDESTIKAILKVFYIRQPCLLKELILHSSDRATGATTHNWGKNKNHVAYRDVENNIIEIIKRVTGKVLKEL